MKINAIILFSRIHLLENIENTIQQLKTSKYNFNIHLIVANSNIYINKDNFDDINIKKLNVSVPNELQLNERRKRIAENFEDAKTIIKKENKYTLVIEDDSLVKNSDIDILVDTIIQKDKMQHENPTGLVSGIQVGRHGINILGLWHCDNVLNPTEMYTPYFYKDLNIQNIDASGLYFMITKTELFLNTQMKVNAFGPDVNFGMQLRSKGFMNYANYNVIIPHITPKGILLPDKNVEQIFFKLVDNQWKRQNSNL